MSIHAPGAVRAKPASPIFAFLFLAVLAACFLGAALVLGTEPRLLLESTGGGSFRVTGSNHFAGRQFFSKTIEGVEGFRTDDAVRDGRRDSERVNRKRRRVLHLEFAGSGGSKVSWSRENDAQAIQEFMRGESSELALADKPPLWRMGAAWFLAGFGALTFLGAIQSFFPKKGSAVVRKT